MQEHPELACEITEDGSRIRLQRQGQELTLYGENNDVRTGKNRLSVRTETGLAAMAEIIVPPTTRPAPKWKQSPYVTCRKGTFTLHYELELEGAQDASLICWELERTVSAEPYPSAAPEWGIVRIIREMKQLERRSTCGSLHGRTAAPVERR